MAAPLAAEAFRSVANPSGPIDTAWMENIRLSTLVQGYTLIGMFLEDYKRKYPLCSAVAGNAYDLARVNRWINDQILYTSAYGDKFQTADETILRGMGDCEDYAILKLQMLRAMGVADENMSLVLYGRMRESKGHVNLHVMMNGMLYILDNEFSDLKDPDNFRFKCLDAGCDYIQVGEIGVNNVNIDYQNINRWTKSFLPVASRKDECSAHI